ncbi:hypothetical protein MCOR27_007000 [Pyricularia oryzae]|uniref:DUF2423 domain-containing protein n=5 Tax=Pyricularia TaxID=48558 RepID=A0ABQ8NTL2_PYRGI|nr:uncharacterized protein MGG_08838 [Pyricularia oryzae 70-15]ELQ42152.1 hypothetical protein OOU_Y34scaffold00228g43 [Pyricularia oryzae Y34]KAH8837224.1 hypothetical protein MCOR01_010861 [Pyricularia oryzae]KAI6301961.1 hypothetical protein MCOR33_002583 [Pyricularia grisea]EHA54050.1 hypothetical protein MGG_08838 [Pyricularia oryzae 70-15]KAH9438113.1 hypothetical protein MCOR02_001753 [Pyricularia oryzae]
MAKSLRASSRKANNQRLKRNVFGPVEAARNERLSAKLMEIATQPKEAKMEDAAPESDENAQAEDAAEDATATVMEVDSGSAPKAASSKKKRVEKKRGKKSKSAIVFSSYKDRITKKKR